MLFRRCGFCLLSAVLMVSAFGQTGDTENRDLMMRERYETALFRDPLQQRIFDETYSLYLRYDGVEAWTERIETLEEGEAWIKDTLLGKIFARQLKTGEALEHLERARAACPSPEWLSSPLAKLYYETGRDKKALDLLERALETEKDLEEWNRMVRMLGAIHQRQGNRDSAVATWKRLVEKEDAAAFAYKELAGIYEDNHLWSEAALVYEQLVEMSADEPYQRCRAMRSLGDVLRRQRDFERAIAVYEEAMQWTAPGSWLFESLKERLVSTYQDMGHLSGLAEYLEQRIEAAPAEVEYRDLQADTYLRLEAYEKAEQACRALLERDARHVGAYEKLITIYKKQKEFEKLFVVFDELIALFPEEVDFIRRLGEAHLNAGDETAAKAAWRRGLGEEPDGWQYVQLADWLDSYNFPGDAIEAYKKAVEMQPERAWALALATLEYENGNESAAHDIWMSSVDEATSTPDEVSEIAALLETHQFTEDALALYERAVAAEEDNSGFRMSLADSLFRAERFEEALASYLTLLEAGTEAFFQERGEYGALRSYEALELLDEKCGELEKRVEAEPENTTLFLRLARFYDYLGRRARSIELYENALKMTPDNAELSRALAQAYQNNHRYKEALETYKRLNEIDKNRSGVHYEEILKIHTRLQAKEDAVAAAEKLAELRPSDAETRITLATTYQSFGEAEKGLQQYRHALRLNPNEPFYYEQYGEALTQQKKMGEAQDAYRQMLEVADTQSARLQAINALAGIYVRLGKEKTLIEEFRAETLAKPRMFTAYEELAEVQKSSNDSAGALKTLERAIGVVEDEEAALRKTLMLAYELNNLEKVLECQQALMARSGKPTIDDYERLANTYLRMGKMEEAEDYWQRMIDENPVSSDAHKRVAKSMMEYGLLEEALAHQRTALELDPYDYKLRYDLAQKLAMDNQAEEAVKELKVLLDLGEGPKAEEESKQAKSAKGQHSFGFGPCQSCGGFHGSSRRGGSVWQGTFQDFRPQLIQHMFAMALQAGVAEELLTAYESRMETETDNIDLLQDMAGAYQSMNRMTEEQEILRRLLEFQPDNLQLVFRLTSLHQQAGEFPEARQTYDAYLARNPDSLKNLLQPLVNLLIQQDNTEEALQLIETALKDAPDDIGILSTAAHAFSNMKKLDEAASFFKRLAEVDPTQAPRWRMQRAEIYMRNDEDHKAWELYAEALKEFAAAPIQPGRPAAPSSILSSMGGNRSMNFSNFLSLLLPASNSHYVREALKKMATLEMGNEDLRLADFWEEIARKTASLEELGDSQEVAQTLNLAKLQMAWRFGNNELEGVEETLALLREHAPNDIAVEQARIYLLRIENDYEGILAICDDLELRFPSKTTELAGLRINMRMLNNDFEEVAKLIREQIQSPSVGQQAISYISQLRQHDGTLAERLLMELLEKRPKDFGARQVLTQFYAAAGKHDEAVKIAREVWEDGGARHGGMRGGSGMYRGGMMGGSGMYPYQMGGHHGGNQNQKLNFLLRTYQSAGRMEELTREFEQKLEEQPNSPQAISHAIQLYNQSGKRLKKLALSMRLAETQPRNTQVRMNLVNELCQTEMYEQAMEVFEKMPRLNAAFYRNASHSISRAYTELGETERLGKLEAKMLQGTRDPNQLQQLAQMAGQRKDFKTQKLIYERILAINPHSMHIYSQYVAGLLNAGEIEQGIDTFEKAIALTQANRIWMDGNLAKRIIAAYEKIGRLEDFRALCADTPENKLNDDVGRLLRAELARHEKRYEDAIAEYETLINQAHNSGWSWQIALIAMEMGDADKAIQYAKKSALNRSPHRFNELAQQFMAKEDTENAVRCWNEYVFYEMRNGSSHVCSNVLNDLFRHKLWDAGEALYRKYRKKLPPDDYGVQEMDRRILEQYFRHDRFEALVEEFVFEKVTERTGDLIRQNSHHNEKTKKLAEEWIMKLIEANPTNKSLIKVGVSILSQRQKNKEALALYDKLGGYGELDANQRRQYIQFQIQAGMKEEAYTLLRAEFEESPSVANFRILTQHLRQVGEQARLDELQEEALTALEETKHDEIKGIVAQLKAAYGMGGNALEDLRKRFEDAPNSNTLQPYINALKKNGEDAELIRVAKLDVTAEALSEHTYIARELIGALLQLEESDLVLELVVNMMRQARYSPTNTLQQIIQSSGNDTDVKPLFEPLEKKLREEPFLWTRKTIHLLIDQYKQNKEYDKALALCEERLEKFPREPATRAKRMETLKQSLPKDEFLTLLEKEWGEMAANERQIHARSLIQAYLTADKKEQATTLIDDLEISDTSGEGFRQRGDLYMQVEAYEKAAEAYKEFEKLMASTRHRNQNAHGNMALAYAKVGMLEESAKLAKRVNNSGHLKSIVEVFEEKERVDLAVSVLQAQPGSYVQNNDLAVKLMGYLIDSDEDYAPVLTACFENVRDSYSRRRLAEKFAKFVTERNLLDDFLSVEDINANPGAASMVTHLWLQSGEEDEHAAALQKAFDAIVFEIPREVMEMAEQSRNRNRDENQDKYVALMAKAIHHPDVGNDTLRRAVNQFTNGRSDTEEVLLLCKEIAKKAPKTITEHVQHLQLLAESEHTALAEEIITILVESAENEDLGKFHRAYFDFYRGKKTESVATMKALAEKSSLDYTARLSIAQSLHNAKEYDAALALYEKLIEEEQDSANSAHLYHNVTSLAFRTDAVEKSALYTARYISKSPPEQYANGGSHWFDHENADQLGVLDKAFAKVAGENPAGSSAAALLGWYYQLAQHNGAPETPDEIAKRWNLPDDVVTKSWPWTRAMEGWAIAEPYPSDKENNALLDPPQELMQWLKAEKATCPGEHATDEKEVTNYVQPYEALGLNQWENREKVVASCAEIRSPDHREATFAIEFHGSITVWKDGELVLQHLSQNHGQKTTSRINTSLKKGMNRVAVLINTPHNECKFRLYAKENGEGLVFSTPEQAQAEDAEEGESEVDAVAEMN
jgi:tetratricopeptide (TPR) repeat protein